MYFLNVLGQANARSLATQIWFSQMNCRDPSTWMIICCLPACTLAGSLVESRVAGPKLGTLIERDVGTPNGNLTVAPNPPVLGLWDTQYQPSPWAGEEDQRSCSVLWPVVQSWNLMKTLDNESWWRPWCAGKVMYPDCVAWGRKALRFGLSQTLPFMS